MAALFAVHPLHVESVAWVSERKDILSAVFFFLMLHAYSRYARAPSVMRYLAVAVLFAAGLMSKPMLVSAPIILLLLDYWPLRRFEQPSLIIGKTKISECDNQRRIYTLYLEKFRCSFFPPSLVSSHLSCKSALPALSRHCRSCGASRTHSLATSFTSGKHYGQHASRSFILIQMTLWHFGKSFSRSCCCWLSLPQRSFFENNDLIC